MKVKLKLDKATIVDFLSSHAEKVVFAGVVLGSLMLMIPSGDGSFDRTPDDLQSAAQTAQANIDSTPAPPVPPSNKMGEHERYVDLLLKTKVKLAPYDWNLYLDDVIFAQRKPRGTPPLLPVRDLRATAGTSAVVANRARLSIS